MAKRWLPLGGYTESSRILMKINVKAFYPTNALRVETPEITFNKEKQVKLIFK